MCIPVYIPAFTYVALFVFLLSCFAIIYTIKILMDIYWKLPKDMKKEVLKWCRDEVEIRQKQYHRRLVHIIKDACVRKATSCIGSLWYRKDFEHFHTGLSKPYQRYATYNYRRLDMATPQLRYSKFYWYCNPLMYPGQNHSGRQIMNPIYNRTQDYQLPHTYYASNGSLLTQDYMGYHHDYDPNTNTVSIKKL